MREVRVLIVEHSATVCAVLRRMLGAGKDVLVVGEATDRRGAVEQTQSLQPDVIVLDVDLPNMDGFSAVQEIMQRRPTPIVAIASRVRQEQMADEFRSLNRGGIGVLAKPEVPEEWQEFGRILPETILQLGSLKVAPDHAGTEAPEVSGHKVSYLAIGSSTGGPGAVCQLLKELGQRFPVGIAVVQHIAPGFEYGLADWLSHELQIDVKVARDGELLRANTVRLAEAASHLRIDSGLQLRLDTATPPIRGHRPSANELFSSFCRVCPSKVAAVLLTGMGDDGVDGMLALHEAGALTITQDEASSVVFGMPRAALERKATDIALPPSEIGRLLARVIREGGDE